MSSFEFDSYQETVFNLIDGVNENNLEKVKINNAKLLEIFATTTDPYLKNTYIYDTDYMPLYIAAKNGYLDIVKYLVLEGQADINHQDWLEAQTALHVAVENEHIEVVDFLIQNGSNINLQNYDNKYTPLDIAVEIGNEEIVKMLMMNKE